MPLFLERPYEEAGGGEGGSKSTMAIFDATRLFPRKFKPRPEAAEELRECKQPLSPKELLMVTGGPKTIDFGTISVFSNPNPNTNPTPNPNPNPNPTPNPNPNPKPNPNPTTTPTPNPSPNPNPSPSPSPNPNPNPTLT